MTYKMHIVAN